MFALLAATSLFWAAAPGKGEEIRLGFFPNITHAQALYAKATHEFEKQTGAAIKWTAFNAGPTAIESLLTDAIDATYIGPGPVINGYIKSRGEKFVIIAGAASGGAGLVVREDAGITSERNFNGKIIATPQLGNTQDIAARLWLLRNNYKLRETGGTVSLLPLAGPDQLNMFKKKEIDAAWTIEPWISRLEMEGGGKLFVDEKDLWPHGKYATTQLVVTRAFLAKNRCLVGKLLGAHVEITQKINKDKEAAGQRINDQLAKEIGKPLKPEIISKALERVDLTWDPISYSLHKNAAAAFQIGFLKTASDLKGLYALDVLNEVLASRNLEAVKGEFK